MARRRKREEAPLSLFSFQDIMACLTGILILTALLLALDGLSEDVSDARARQDERSPEEIAAEAARVEELRRLEAELAKAIESRGATRPVSETEAAVAERRAEQLRAEAEELRGSEASLRAQAERARRDREDAERLAREARERLAAAERDAKAKEVRQRFRFRPGEVYAKAPVFVEPMHDRVVVGELDANGSPVVLAELRDPGADERVRDMMRSIDPGSRYLLFVVHDDAIARFSGLWRRSGRFEVGWQLWDGKSSLFEGVGPAATGAVP
jgi:signal transduction histidine kinase